jgi:hypothetical protein
MDGGTGKRWLRVVLAAALTAFLAVAAELSVAASGPGPGLAASAAPAAPTPLGHRIYAAGEDGRCWWTG